MDKKWWLLIVIMVMIATWLLINLVNQSIYDIGACTINSFNCTTPECPEWNGVCTQEIKDECCESVRVCDGQLVDDYTDCLDKYCWESGKECEPVYDVATTKYKCTCKDVFMPL